LATVAHDLGTIKIQAYVKGKMVASTYTDSVTTGAFSIVVESKYLNKNGITQVYLKLSSNKFYWMDQKFVVDRQVD
jgi:ABC-type sugar transport system substrate-binding protein